MVIGQFLTGFAAFAWNFNSICFLLILMSWKGGTGSICQGKLSRIIGYSISVSIKIRIWVAWVVKSMKEFSLSSLIIGWVGGDHIIEYY